MSSCDYAIELLREITAQNDNLYRAYQQQVLDVNTNNQMCNNNKEHDLATVNAYASFYGDTISHATGAPDPNTIPGYPDGFPGGWKTNKYRYGKYVLTNGGKPFKCPLNSNEGNPSCRYTDNSAEDYNSGMRQCCLDKNGGCSVTINGVDKTCWVGCYPESSATGCFISPSDLNTNKIATTNLFSTELGLAIGQINSTYTSCRQNAPLPPIYKPTFNIECCQSIDFSGITANNVNLENIKNICNITGGTSAPTGGTSAPTGSTSASTGGLSANSSAPLSDGAKAGISIFVILAFIGIILLSVFLSRRKKQWIPPIPKPQMPRTLI